jgi:hypothetical protein
MKKTVAVIAMSLCCWFLADGALSKCNPANRTAKIEIVVSDTSFSYMDKEDDPVPCIFRQKDIVVEVKFYGNRHKYIEMRNFRALAFFNHGQGWRRDDEEDLDEPLEMLIDDDIELKTIVRFENPGTSTEVKKTLVLQGNKAPGQAHGPNRLITFDLAFQDDNGADVMVFDPPWGERP